MATINDFGIKVALPGFDVKTATPEQCSMHSSYPHLKLQRPTSGKNYFNTLSYTFASNPASGSTTNIFTLAHGYGYKPACMGFVYANTGVGAPLPIDSYLTMPAALGTALNAQYFQCWADSTNFKIEFVAPSNAINVNATVWTIKYYIFVENGA